MSDIIDTSEDIVEIDTEIIRDEKTDNLQISADDLGEGPLAVFLYTPTMKDTSDHYHICMDEEQGQKLHTWLTKWLWLVKEKKKKN